MSYVIYKHENKTNGKIYIGQTRQNVKQRWKNGNGYWYNKHFYNSIKKYGWDNFKHEILFENLTKEEADKKEIEMISLYNSNNPKYGYNLTIGGGGTNGYHLTEEQRNNISKWQTGRHLTEEWKRHIGDSLRGEKHPFYGKKLSEGHRRKLSESHKGQKSAMGMLGKKHSDETKRRMSEARMGHLTSKETRDKIGKANSRAVRCIETGIVYPNLPVASKETGCPKSGISMCCNGKQNASKGYHWEYID